MNDGRKLRARVAADLTRRVTAQNASGAIACDACSSTSWVFVTIEHRRHELSLVAIPPIPIKDDDTTWDELTTERVGWFCGVCKIPAPARLVGPLNGLLLGARPLRG